MDRLTQQLTARRSILRRAYVECPTCGDGGTAAAAARRGVSPAPIPGDKRVREQRPRQTEVSRGIHILKAAGTRLQQGVPLTLFIHLRSSGAGAAVAGAGAHGACHQVPI